MIIKIDRDIYYPIIKRLCVDNNYNGTCPFDHQPLVKQIAKIQSKTAEDYDCYLKIPVMMCPKCSLIYISLVSYYHLIEKVNTIDFFYIIIEPNAFVYFKEQYYGSGAPISNDSKWFQSAKGDKDVGIESMDLQCSKQDLFSKNTNPKIVQKIISDYESNRKQAIDTNGKPVIKTYDYVAALNSKDEPFGLQEEIKVVDEAKVCPDCYVTTTTIQTVLSLLCNGKSCNRKLLTSLQYCLNCNTYLMDENAMQRLMVNLNPSDDGELYSIKICNGNITKRGNYLNLYRFIKTHPVLTQETAQKREELRIRYSTGTNSGEMQEVFLYKSNCRCLYCLHEFNYFFIECEQIKIKTFSGNVIPAQVFFCKSCGRRFLNEDMYFYYTHEHGALYIIARRMNEDNINGHFSNYNQDSILSQCGYYVSIDRDPGVTIRREILRMIIIKRLATKASLIELLTSFYRRTVR